MDWVRDLLPSKVTEISEYFVYFGIFGTHNREQRSSQDAKREFLAGPNQLLLHPVAGGQAVQVALDEGIQSAVHDAVDVGSLTAGTGILDQGVGHEDVVTDLTAPLDLLLSV